MKITRVAYITVIAAGLNGLSSCLWSLLTLAPGVGGTPDSLADSRFAMVVAYCVGAVCVFGFFLALYRELAKSPSPISLRSAGLAAAIANGLSLVAALAMYIHLRAWNIWMYLLTAIVWIWFFAVFYVVPDPLHARITRILAGVLAIYSGYRACVEVVQLPTLVLSVLRGLGVTSGSLFQQTWVRIAQTFFALFYHCCLLALLGLMSCVGRRQSDPVESLQDVPRGVV